MQCFNCGLQLEESRANYYFVRHPVGSVAKPACAMCYDLFCIVNHSDYMVEKHYEWASEQAKRRAIMHGDQ